MCEQTKISRKLELTQPTEEIRVDALVNVILAGGTKNEIYSR